MIDLALPTLQAAVDTLHARLSSGRERATGSAAVTGLTGPLVGPLSPDAFTTLGDVLSGRFGEQMRAIWGREDIAAQGISEQDWAFECEAAWHAIRRGLDDDRAARIIEELVRSGLYRTKHDERRGNTTWLGQDAANAVATVRKRIAAKSGPILDLDEDEPPADAPADETPEQTISRLTRELAQEHRARAQDRAVLATQATIIRTERERADELDRRAKETRDLLRNPTLSTTDKVVFLTITWRVESARSRGQDETRVYYPEIAEASGTSVSTVGRTLKRVAADDEKPWENPEAPIVKRTQTEWRMVEDPATGERTQLPTSVVTLRAKGDGSILSAAATYRMPDRPQHGGKRLPRCAEHPDADLIIRSTTHCARCRKTLGPPTETLRRQVDIVEGEEPTVDVVTNGRQVDIVERPRTVRGQDAAVRSDGDEFTLARADRIAREAVAINLRPPDAWKQPGEPISDSHERASLGPLVVTPRAPAGVPVGRGGAPKPKPCPACDTREPHELRNGVLRCMDCGHEGAVSAAPVPTGVSNGRIVMTRGADGVMEGFIGTAPGVVNLNPIFMDRRCCKTDGLVRPLGDGTWRCDGCGGSGVAS